MRVNILPQGFIAKLVPMFAPLREGYVCLLMFSSSSVCPYHAFCLLFNQQVKIKRKQLLIRKGIEPVVSFDDMKNAPAASNGTSTFLFFFDFSQITSKEFLNKSIHYFG
jgi:hypothetical protein